MSNKQQLSRQQTPGRYIAAWMAWALLFMAFIGCREHPRVTSRQSLEFIKQVYTACNTRSGERLAACRAKFEELIAQSQIGQAEQESFQSILSLAEAGDWEAAQRSSLQFARDQVR